MKMLKVYYIKNDTFRELETQEKPKLMSESTAVLSEGLEFVAELRKNKKDINEHVFGDISSFNFSRDVFFSGRWNDITTAARGLFIDTKSGEIVARGYEKFFAHNERVFNNDIFIRKNIQLPVSVYEKYNGFLGLVGVHAGKLLFCSKSQIGGPHCAWLEKIFRDSFNADKEEELVKWLTDNNSCMAFEVIDPANDPHIVKYEKPQVILLDVLKRTRKFEALSYDELLDFAMKFGLTAKEKVAEIDDVSKLLDYINEMENDETPGKEGVVISDAADYHIKVKTQWYKDWKFMRGFIPKIAAGHPYSTSGFTKPFMNEFLAFCKKQDKEKLKTSSLIALRDEFYSSKENN